VASHLRGGLFLSVSLSHSQLIASCPFLRFLLPQITFNPLTPKMILKTLTAIGRLPEGAAPRHSSSRLCLPRVHRRAEWGDLRRAICQVQLLLAGYRGSSHRGLSAGDGSKGAAHAQQGWTWDPGGEEDEWGLGGAKRNGRGQSKRGQKGGAGKGAGRAGGGKRGRSRGEGRVQERAPGLLGMALCRRAEGTGEGGALQMAFPRDHSLTLFHAIGKFLHNKRKHDQGQGQEPTDPSQHPAGSRNSNSTRMPQPHASTQGCNGRALAPSRCIPGCILIQ